jgi:hypothetical protein
VVLTDLRGYGDSGKPEQEIVESIVEGRQPTTLTAEALTRRIELPLSWCSQRTTLNVE